MKHITTLLIENIKRVNVFKASLLGRRIIRGITWSFIGVFISKIFVLLGSYICARSLGPNSFGKLGIIQSTVQMIGTFASFGLASTATKYIAENRTDFKKIGSIIYTVIGLGLILTTVSVVFLLLLSLEFSQKLLNDNVSRISIAISSIILFFNTLVIIQNGILTGFESFRAIALRSIISSFISLIFMIFVVSRYKLNGAILSLGLTQFINFIFNSISIRKEIKLNKIGLRLFSFDLKIIKDFSIPAMLASILVTPVSWICNVLLINAPNGYYEMGIFNAASQWNNAVMLLPSTISSIVLPILSSINNNEKRADYKFVLKTNIIINGLIASTIVILILFASEIIMKGYGDNFVNGVPVLCVLVLSCIFSSINCVIGQAIASKGKMWIGFLFNLLWAILLLLFALVFIRVGFGALSLSLAFLLAYIFHTIWQSLYLKRLLR